jgi:hypothetical protein
MRLWWKDNFILLIFSFPIQFSTRYERKNFIFIAIDRTARESCNYELLEWLKLMREWVLEDFPLLASILINIQFSAEWLEWKFLSATDALNWKVETSIIEQIGGWCENDWDEHLWPMLRKTIPISHFEYGWGDTTKRHSDYLPPPMKINQIPPPPPYAKLQQHIPVSEVYLLKTQNSFPQNDIKFLSVSFCSCLPLSKS